MPLPATHVWTWARQHLFVSNSRQAWEDRLSLLAFVCGGAGLYWFTGELPLSRQVLLWGLWLVVLAVLLRRGWLRLFGPVLFYDLVRTARRNRYFLLRFLYTLGLGLLISWFYWVYTLRYEELGGDASKPSIREQALFAEVFFYTFMWVQFLAVVLLTPAYTAGAVADEKDRRTLEFLLATDLENREIVLGKWLARVANLALLLLAGVPILAMNLFLGGVDPDLMVAGFTATGLTLVSLAGVSILASVYSRKARDAIVLAYLVVAAYYALTTVGLILALTLPGFGNQGIYLGSFTLTVGDVMQWLNTGNIFVALFELLKQTALSGALPDTLPRVLRDYAVFHGVLTLLTVGLAAARLRAVALKEQVVKAARKGRRGRPTVGNYSPVLWKEVFAESGQGMNRFGRIVVYLLVGLSFVPFALIVYYFFEDVFISLGGSLSHNWEQFGSWVNVWVRIAGMLVACLTLLGVGVRASGAISGERDRQTLDGLLTTPLSSNDILWGKWLGSLAGARWGLIWVGLIWLVGTLSGGLHPFMLVLLTVFWLVYAGVIALLGLWFSMVSKTTLRATVWTVLITIVAAIGHWILWSCCMPFFIITRFSGGNLEKVMEALAKFQMGLSPPVVLSAMLPWRARDFDQYPPGWANSWNPLTMMGYAFLGLLIWGAAGTGLWAAASARFRQMTGREPRMPLGRAPRPRPAAAADKSEPEA